jgi:hypothetical protein
MYLASSGPVGQPAPLFSALSLGVDGGFVPSQCRRHLGFVGLDRLGGGQSDFERLRDLILKCQEHVLEIIQKVGSELDAKRVDSLQAINRPLHGFTYCWAWRHWTSILAETETKCNDSLGDAAAPAARKSAAVYNVFTQTCVWSCLNDYNRPGVQPKVRLKAAMKALTLL